MTLFGVLKQTSHGPRGMSQGGGASSALDHTPGDLAWSPLGFALSGSSRALSDPGPLCGMRGVLEIPGPQGDS